jgi:hypothetical protein
MVSEDWGGAKAGEASAQANLLRANLSCLLANGGIGCGDRRCSEINWRESVGTGFGGVLRSINILGLPDVR